jgi:hypothetical protein
MGSVAPVRRRSSHRASELAPVVGNVPTMRQPLPVIKAEIFLPGVAWQVAGMACVALVIHYGFILPLWPATAFASPIVYMAFCRIMRWRFAGHHRGGIRAYRARRFDEAVVHNRASFEFFERHPWMDRWRFLLFGTASRTPYKTMALGNLAYSEVMRGNRSLAVSLFEQALRLTPGYANAEVGLAMLGTTESGIKPSRDGNNRPPGVSGGVEA